MSYSEEELAEALRRNPDLKVATNSPAPSHAQILADNAKNEAKVPGDKPSKYHNQRTHPEKDLEQQVIDYAHLTGWLVAHFRPAKTDKGWRTPVSADGKGFLDLVLVRERVVWAECKVDDGKLTPDQQKWYDALTEARQEVYLFRPKTWQEIIKILA